MTTRLYQPEELRAKFIEYCNWVDMHPLNRYSLIQKTGETVAVPIGRPLSLKAFCLHCGMSSTLFAAYAKLPEYLEVMDFIKTSVYVNKYEGAAVGLFSSSIMIRDLGLSDSIVHILDDTRKSVSELFPSMEEINAIEVKSTDQNTIMQLNAPNETDQQELSILNSDSAEPIETWGSPRGIEQKREDFLLG